MTIKKPADDLVLRLARIHDEYIEDVLRDYLDEYADCGWDSICTKLAKISTAIDSMMTELKFARIRAYPYAAPTGRSTETHATKE